MRKLLFICVFAISLAFPIYGHAEVIGGTPLEGRPTVGPGIDISDAYLRQARAYRNEGRYELSRQAYAQALSTCRNNVNLEVIRRELAGVELLIRTMR